MWRVDKHYGSNRGCVLTLLHRFHYLLGKYRRYCNIDWASVQRLVFVCKGNICRSAYAEAVARAAGIDAISCGLDTVVDAPANKDAILTASSRGFDLENHKTRPIMYVVLRNTDLLVVMEPWHARFLETHLARPHVCTLLGLWKRPVRPYIQDPYGLSAAYLDNCFRYIQDSVYEITEKIQRAGN